MKAADEQSNNNDTSIKQSIKTAATHELSVLGKTVPTLAVAALLLVGGGSAAVLSNFGTITGTADINQAVELDEEDTGFSFDSNQVAGETVVETRTLESNANVPTEIGFETSCTKGNGDEEEIDGPTADFNNGCKGIDTNYVEYYDDAGHNFNDYTSPSAGDADAVVDASGETGEYTTIQEAIDAAGTDSIDTILVKAGSYDGTVTVDQQVNIVAENSPTSDNPSTVSGASNGFDIEASEVTVKGFEVMASVGDDGSPNARGIDVLASGATVENNYVHNVTDEERPIGIHLFVKDEENGAVVTNNYIEGVEATQLPDLEDADNDRSESKAKGIALTGGAGSGDNVEISHNTIKDIGNKKTALASAINIYGGAQDFTVESNEIGAVDHKVTQDAPFDLGVYVSGYGSDSYGADSVVTRNNFVSTDSDYADVATFESDNELTAESNWFGTNGIQVGSKVDASFETKTDTSIEPETSDRFGVINDFAINLKPDVYTLTTTITADGAEQTG